MVNQLQQLFFISAATVGIAVRANVVYSMTVTAGHFHHWGILCHGFSFLAYTDLQKEKQRGGETSRVACVK